MVLNSELALLYLLQSSLLAYVVTVLKAVFHTL